MVKIKLTYSIYCGLPILKDKMPSSCYNIQVNLSNLQTNK